MISDEPDEDADCLDDETLLATYAGVKPPTPESHNAAEVREWPRLSGAPAGPEIDAATLAWFKANHADWQEELRLVLRTWVALHAQPTTDAQLPG